jgi:glycosyltransferase involved in cell wall biosynthesis
MRIIERSSRVRGADFAQPWFKERVDELGEPFKIHRKLWEFAVIAQVYKDLLPSGGGRVLGFGCGKEPLPSFFAAAGARVVATDLGEGGERQWASTGQRSSSVADLARPQLIDPDAAAERIEFRPVDMREIPDDLRQAEFDLVWSAGSLEHLGGIRAGMDFILASMDCLRVGGVAVHTTEFNFLKRYRTLEAEDLCFYRERDLEQLFVELSAAGHEVLPLDLGIGQSIADVFVDMPPYDRLGVHLNVGGFGNGGEFVTTSVSIVAVKSALELAGRNRVVVDLGEREPLSVIVVGDAEVSTGFAHCTHAIAQALYDRGHKTTVLGISHFGDPSDCPYPILVPNYPMEGDDRSGIGRLPHIVSRVKADAVVLVQDPWNVNEYLFNLDAILPADVEAPTMIGYLAVDAMNQHGQPLNRLDSVIVWTEFAKDELREGGYTGPIKVIPLGVDVENFRPRDKVEAREKLGLPKSLPADAFIVGYVGRNQQRKRIDLLIAAFARWVKTNAIDNAYLYLHIGPTGEASHNVRSLAKHYGLVDRVLLQELEIQHGHNAEMMAWTYAALDVFATATQGEGWCLPALEAMASRVACVVSGFSGLGSWVGDAAVKVRCPTLACNAPLRNAHTIGAVPDVDEFAAALNDLYRSEIHRKTYALRGHRLAQESRFRWENIGGAVADEVERAAAFRRIARRISRPAVEPESPAAAAAANDEEAAG